MLTKLGLNTTVPYHFLFYSVVFGGTSFYSYVVSPIVFKKLPREQFSSLQTTVFPYYFLTQSVAPIVLALTSPLKLCPFTIGLFAASSLGGLVNYLFLLPRTHAIKEKRDKLHAEKADKTESGEHTEEYASLTKQFGAYHGSSLLANLVSVATLGFYGLLLAKRLIK
ncbi:uncharacterized protein RJT20DRAFT_128774 [Scheffersomyces xylosifermentans]|uniref:uncharacterized protein n=1 Tax=Scheffersomyces xylosifermentans TaxID=1304137 RepID=UPI00315DC49B